MNTTTSIAKRTLLTENEITEMYAVFSKSYKNTQEDRFRADLDGKDWVILLLGADRKIVGFSTLEVYRHEGPCGPAVIMYSGDTVVDHAHRTSGHLAGAFGHLMLHTIKGSNGVPVYWLLTSKGARTYRFLPVFFRNFYPAFDSRVPPDVKRLIDEVAKEKFGKEYSVATQTVCHQGLRDTLNASEVVPILKRTSDAHIRFFLERNPGYVQGDELVCIARVAEHNLNSRSRRVIECTEVEWRI